MAGKNNKKNKHLPPQRSYRKLKLIEGESLKLVKTKFDHAQELFRLIKTRGVLENLTIEIDEFLDMVEYLRFTEHQWQMNQDFTYTIMKLDNTIMGQISLYNVSFTHYRAEIGIWLGKPFQNLGYGIKSLKLLVNFSFNDFLMNRLQAHMFINNPASQKLFQKAGFQKEGILRDFVKKKEQFISVYTYSFLKSEYFHEIN